MRQLHLLVSVLVLMSAQELLFLNQTVSDSLQHPQALRTLQGTSVKHWLLKTLNHWLITWAANRKCWKFAEIKCSSLKVVTACLSDDHPHKTRYLLLSSLPDSSQCF